MSDVYLDEKYVGTVEHPKEFLKNFVEERRKQKVSSTINVSYEPEFDEVSIHTATGRVRRPLIIVENGKALLTEDHLKKLSSGDMRWQDLIEQAIIEYLDANEEENTLVALTERDLTKEHKIG